MTTKQNKILYWALPMINVVWVLLIYYNWYPFADMFGENVVMELGQMYHEPPMPFLMPLILIMMFSFSYLFLFIIYKWYNKWVISGFVVLVCATSLYDYITGHFFDGTREFGTDLLILVSDTLAIVPWLVFELYLLKEIKTVDKDKDL